MTLRQTLLWISYQFKCNYIFSRFPISALLKSFFVIEDVELKTYGVTFDTMLCALSERQKDTHITEQFDKARQKSEKGFMFQRNIILVVLSRCKSIFCKFAFPIYRIRIPLFKCIRFWLSILLHDWIEVMYKDKLICCTIRVCLFFKETSKMKLWCRTRQFVQCKTKG